MPVASGPPKMDQLDISCRASYQHFTLLIVVHGLAVYALVLSGQHLLVQTATSVAVGLSFYRLSRLSLLLHPRSIERLNARKGHWQLTLRNGERRQVMLTGEVLVWPLLVVARFKDQDETYALVLLSDSVAVDEHRLSRVYFSLYAFSHG